MILFQYSTDAGFRDAVSFRNIVEAHSAGSISLHRGSINLEWTASDLPAFELGATHAGAAPFDNRVTFELVDRADDDDERSTEWAASVDVLAERYERDLQTVQLIERFEQMADRSRHAVERPHDYDIKLATSGIGQVLIESRALGFRTTDLVGVYPTLFLGACVPAPRTTNR